MPELPEVEIVRRGLELLTLNQKIESGEVLLKRTIAAPVGDDASFLKGIQGSQISGWMRRGKYLIAELLRIKSDRESQSAGFLGVHLRMTGQLLWIDQEEPVSSHTRLRLFMAGGKELRFLDQRTFGKVWWVPPGIQPSEVITGLQFLGPEPFSEDFSTIYLRAKFQKTRRPIKTALLDQSLVAGIGNIYADEALFLSGIHPQHLCNSLDKITINKLRNQIIAVLKTSLEANGTTFSSFRSVEGTNGNYGGKAWVYGRDGDSCRNCETIINRIKLAGRSAHYCPACQIADHKSV